MKLVSIDDSRPDDRSDLLELSKVADDAEWARAETAVRLITERGFGRATWQWRWRSGASGRG